MISLLLSIIGSITGVGLAGLLFGVLFMRSSKKFPLTFSQWWTEIQWQWHGFIGLAEDHLLRFKNKTALISQPGRVAVITGGNRGIGLGVVVKLLQCDYTVIMGVRDPVQARTAVELAITSASLPATVATNMHYEALDIGSMQSVRQFADRVRAKFTQLHVLINNAGIMAAPYRLTADGFEEQLAVNYMGHFLLTHRLLPLLRAGGTVDQRARIVNVSSCVHRQGVINFDDLHGKNYSYPPEAYNQSKLAQVLFTKHLQLQLSARALPIQTNTVHPGIVDTGLFCYSTSTYVPWFKRIFFKTPEEGARTIVHAAIAPQLEDKGGSYISNCTMQRTNPVAKDERLCASLFAITSKELGIEDFFVAA